MELTQKAAGLPLDAGVYLFKDALGNILYVGKSRSLRNRVRSYFLESRWLDAKTGSLVREIADFDYIVVDNDREALALENNLIKQHKPKFNVLLRDDKTYPYIRFTAFEKFPRVYVTRRLVKDGSIYFGPYFPHSLAHRIVHFIHKTFRIPSCTVDLTRVHPRPCLQYYIRRCLGPCAPGLTTDELYTEAARDTKMFLEGRRHDLIKSLESRMSDASDSERYEQAASYRDLLRTLTEIEERQKIAAAAGDDTDVLAWHAEPPLVAVNLFHLRGGRVVDRRDFYWEDLEIFEPAEFLSALLKQLYLDAAYLPRAIHVPMDFEDRAVLEDILSERAANLEPPRSRVEILMPQRGAKHAFLELVEKNARHSFEQRFRVLKPSSKAIVDALEQALSLPEPPRRIESFDISHLQGSDTVASMVVWEDGRMKKSDYRKFIIRGHAAAAALEKLEVINQSVASIAKQEEIIYVLGQEDQPIRLEHHSPILHLIQQIRDETHRFAVGFHRQRRTKRTIQTGLENIPGVGPRTAQKLLRRFGSITQLRSASVEQIARVVPATVAERVSAHLANNSPSTHSAEPSTAVRNR